MLSDRIEFLLQAAVRTSRSVILEQEDALQILKAVCDAERKADILYMRDREVAELRGEIAHLKEKLND